VGSEFDTVLFDLDGTISDSAPGILGSLRAAFTDVGVPWVDDDVARSLLGPPFWHSLPPLVGQHRLDAVVASYRRHYVDQEAMFDTRVYPGVADVLSDLAHRGARLGVATSKPEPHALRILSHLGLADRFAVVGGDTLDGALGSKAMVIADVLRRLDTPGTGTILMVGDRSHDVLGAAANGLVCAGVLWGYGTEAELRESGARWLCREPSDVTTIWASRCARDTP
jgi:phosphoglycolate phosphatase